MTARETKYSSTDVANPETNFRHLGERYAISNRLFGVRGAVGSYETADEIVFCAEGECKVFFQENLRPVTIRNQRGRKNCTGNCWNRGYMAFIRYELPLIIWILTMLTLTSIPGRHLPPVGDWGLDKLVHFFEYGLLVMLLFRYLRFRRKLKKNISILIGAAFCLLLAAADELHQIPIPSRSASWRDLAADLLGISTGLAIVWFAGKENCEVDRNPDRA